MRAFITIATVALGASACAQAPAPGAAREFICVSDDKLTERHVGVLRARPSRHRPAWQILYTDGAVAQYLQQPGESCGTQDSAQSQETRP